MSSWIETSDTSLLKVESKVTNIIFVVTDKVILVNHLTAMCLTSLCWSLTELASTGEKEWYFYCPRDRKYRNSVRPNRVTAAGFWKATGTDRPIYSTEGTKCIGLKKSLVFYKGRAARGIKTDWMMHEFRLPTLTDPSLPKKPIDKNIPLNVSIPFAIC